MQSFEIINIDTLIEDSDTCLDMAISFDLQENLETDLEDNTTPVVNVLSKSYNEYVTLDDIYIHNESGNMFMYYDTFIERYCMARRLAYAGTFKCLYDGAGALHAIAFALNK